MDQTNPKDLVGAKKVALELVPPSSLIFQALAMENGAKKYGAYNWRQKKVRAMIYAGAFLRHYAAWLDGEDVAADSGVPHLGHMLACIGIIIDAAESGTLIDDRPVKGPAGALVAKITEARQSQSPEVRVMTITK